MISQDAPAKINLFLKVTGKRDDGYHDIETIFLPLARPSDTVCIAFSESEGITVESEGEPVPSGTDNICHKAAEIFAKLAGMRADWKIMLKKRIPVSAGLGGGSSDAAAILKILNGNYGIFSGSELCGIARKVGADVPFFINPVPSIGMGIGEILEPLGFCPSIPLVIVNPCFPVSSAWAYNNMIRGDRLAPSLKDVVSALRSGDAAKFAKLLHNDLSPALFRKFPVLCILRNFMLDAGACGVEISGSGSSLFAVCESDMKAKEISSVLGEKYPAGIKVF